MLRRPRNGPSEQERAQAVRIDPLEQSCPDNCCAWPGCHEDGEYRAPKSRDSLREFHLFCLTHVRAYNQGWDYFKDMSAAEIEAHRRADTTWHRPTWRLGAKSAHMFRDPFGFFHSEQTQNQPPSDHHDQQEHQMMSRLGLSQGFSLHELKTQYKQMAKRHHPDLNGGDRAAEERLKLINEAYSYLMEHRLYA